MDLKKMQEAVKDELLQNLKCEICWWAYDKNNISIKSLWWYKSLIKATCKKCDTVAEFQAEIKDQGGMEKEYADEISEWKMKTLDNWKAVDYEESEFAKEFDDIKKRQNVQKSVIQSSEINSVWDFMKKSQSFSWLFSMMLVFSVFFTWCANTAEENRQAILEKIDATKMQIEEAKKQAESAYKMWKEWFETVKQIAEDAPAKIKEAKENVEKMQADAIKLKTDLEKKVEDTKNAIDETKKAVDAVSSAMDAINSIWWTETWETK